MLQRKDGAVSTGHVHMGIRYSGDTQRQENPDCPALGTGPCWDGQPGSCGGVLSLEPGWR